MQNKELKNTSLRECPFCGGEAKWFNTECKVYCVNCACSTIEFIDKRDAIEAWNTRKPMDRIVEQLDANYKQAHSDYKDTYNPYYEGQMLAYDIAEQIVKGGAE